MIRSLYAGVSGLDVNQKSMDVIGNNIANVNTIGFKEGRAVFQDLLSQTLVGGKTPTDARGGINPRQVGTGAYLAAVDNIFTPGVLKGTSRPWDVGISGEGLFVVRGEGTQNNYYTRAGDFNFDRSGTLTTPSGYRVQGWMSDPATGVLQNDGVLKDIVLGPEYQVMKPKESTTISMGGVLNTTATPSTLVYKTFLTQAMAQQDIFALKDRTGTTLDLTKGEVVKIKAHATMNTSMGGIVNKAEQNLGLTGATNALKITIGDPPNTDAYSLSYDATNTGAANDGKFFTVADFMQEFNNIMKKVTSLTAADTAVPAAVLTIDNGQFKLNVNSATGFTMNISGGGQLGEIMKGLNGTQVAGVNPSSAEMFYMKSVKAGEDFSDLSSLAIQVNSAMAGQVANSGFSTSVMSNNFGLRDGEVVNVGIMVTTTAGVTVPTTVALTYSAADGPIIGSGRFNTLNEFARELTTAINGMTTVRVGAADVPIQRVNLGYSMNGNTSFSLRWVAGPIEMSSTTLAPGPGGALPNPFFKTMLDSVFTKVNTAGLTVTVPLNATNGAIPVGPIDGKGRISYSYERTNTNNVIDLSGQMAGGDLPNLGLSAGSSIKITYINSAGVTRTAVFTYNPNPAVPETNDSAGATMRTTGRLISALQTYFGMTMTVKPNVTPPVFDLRKNTAIGTIGQAGNSVSFTKVVSTSTTPYLAQLFSDGLTAKRLTAGNTINMNASLPRVSSITGLGVTKTTNGSVFTNNMLRTNSLALGRSVTSEQFLATATPNSRMVDLFSETGQPFGFIENDTSLTFNGQISNTLITRPGLFSIGANTNVQDMMTAMENYLGLGVDKNSFNNVYMENGKITVVGEKGADNNIDFLSILAPVNFPVFNGYTAPTITPASGGSSATSITLYDGQGNAHVVNMLFSLWNEQQNEWRLQVSTKEQFASVAINGAASNELIMKFNPDGTLAYTYDRLTEPVTMLPNPSLRFFAPNGANMLTNVALGLGKSGTADGMIISAVKANSFSSTATDGYTLGNLQQVLFNPAGEVVGSYTNGQNRTVAQLGIAIFKNQQGLLKVGDTMFQETANSGQATVGAALTGSRGEVASSMLENSNVDLSREFTNMIVTQRGFQANSRVITTSDEMIQELLNLKR